jgi:DNA polymerase beta
VPFLHRDSSAAQRRDSSLLRDVVRPLQSAGLIAAAISATPHNWRGIVALPLRDVVDTELNTNSSPRGTWQEVGDRIRDIRAGRGKYVRLDIR